MSRCVAVLAIVAVACASAPPPPVVPPPAPVVVASPPPAPRPAETALEALRRQLQPLRSVPAGGAEIPPEARPYLRALRAGLRDWLLERVRARGSVPPRVMLLAELDTAELTLSRAGEDLGWGSITRLDVLVPVEGLTAVVLGLRLGCASDDALYVFRGPSLTLEHAQDQWNAVSAARTDLRVLASRASRLEGALLVTSRALRCDARWQEVRFEGISEGPSPQQPLARWDLRWAVDASGACGGFDEATLGLELLRNGFETRGCAPEEDGGDPRERRARYRFTRHGIEPAGR